MQHYFSEHKRVTIEKNKNSLTKDTYIDNQPFDFKMTFLFKGILETYFSKSLDNPTDLII